MRIIFYSTKAFERPYLESACSAEDVILFVEDPLSRSTVSKASGFDAVSIFAGDDASTEIIDMLNGYGVNFIAIRAAGYDNIDLQKAGESGIRVANVPAYSPYAVAEHAVALILSLNRKIILADRQVHSNDFRVDSLTGFDLHGKTVGIIGVGKIGGVFAKIMLGFGCRLLGYDISPNKELTDNYGLEYVDLPTLCREATIISIHTCLSPQTRHLVDRKLIGLMQRGVMLINTARGACVNTADIIDALENGHIGYYGTDVYENERGLFFFDHSGEELKDEMLKKLLSLPNVLVTPHQAFATEEALRNIASTTFYNIECWKKNKRPENELTVAIRRDPVGLHG